MVQIGTIEYEAKVVGAREAKAQTDDLQESQEDLGEASESSASSMNSFAGTVEGAGSQSARTGRQTTVLDHSVRLLASTAVFAGGTLAGLAGKVGILAVAMKGGAIAVGILKGALAGLTLGGIAGAVVGGLASLATWFAAGSAGAIAFAGALGFGLGVLGVWALEATGALDAVRDFGAFVGNVLPDWVRDGLLQVLSITVGPLAAFGAFIAGTVRGGFSEGFEDARQVVDIFAGAWERQIDRIAGAFESTIDDMLAKWDLFSSVGSTMFRAGWNRTVPATVSLPSVSVAGREFGGGTIRLPQLQTGGMVRETGAAVVHSGEAVIPEPIVNAATRGGGGGGGDVNVDELRVVINADSFDPSDMSRGDIRKFADRLTRELGKQTTSRAGTR